MSDLFLLSEQQMARIAPYFPSAHGVPRVDDRRVISGIVYVIKHGLQWKDAPGHRNRIGGDRVTAKSLKITIPKVRTKYFIIELIGYSVSLKRKG